MAHIGKSFDELSKVLDEISDREVRTAIGLVRKQRAGVSADSQTHHLQTAISQLEPDELSWLDAVLCVRAQQTGREAAWRRFAESAYREILPGGRILVTEESSSTPARDPRGSRRVA
jgi:hypothetical protein